MSEAFIVDTVCTAEKRWGGRLASWYPVDLVAQVLNAIVERSGAGPTLVKDAFVGCVSSDWSATMNMVMATTPLTACLCSATPRWPRRPACGPPMQHES